MFEHRCQRCKHVWQDGEHNPKRCPHCGGNSGERPLTEKEAQELGLSEAVARRYRKFTIQTIYID